MVVESEGKQGREAEEGRKTVDDLGIRHSAERK